MGDVTDSPYFQIHALIDRGNGRYDALDDQGSYLMSFDSTGEGQIRRLFPHIESVTALQVSPEQLQYGAAICEFICGGMVNGCDIVALDEQGRVVPAEAGSKNIIGTASYYGGEGQTVEVITVIGGVIEASYDGQLTPEGFYEPQPSDKGKPVYISDISPGKITLTLPTLYNDAGEEYTPTPVGILQDPGGYGNPCKIYFRPPPLEPLG